MLKKVVIVMGAGSTYAEALNTSVPPPPLDKYFSVECGSTLKSSMAIIEISSLLRRPYYKRFQINSFA
jgi:hypothetical protein